MNDTKEYIQETLKAQRYFILALQHTNLNQMQLKQLVEIYRMNQQLVYVLGADVPEMEELLIAASQVAYLENLFAAEDEK